MIANRYRILEILQEDPSGRVARVSDVTRPDSPDLILVILNPTADGSEQLALNAWQALASLPPPIWAPVLDVGQAEGAPYCVVAQVTGQPLAAAGPLGPGPIGLASRERLLAEAQQLAHVGSWELDLLTERLSWSDELFRIHGEHPGAFQPAAADMWARAALGDQVQLRTALAHLRETGLPARVEYRVPRPDGTSRVVVMTCEGITDDSGQARRLVASVVDVTEQRELRAIKDEFMAIVGHELRTPLTSIRGSLGMLATGHFGTLEPRGERMLGIAVQNVERLVSLVNDILDLERLGSPQAAPVRSPCDMGTLLTQASEAMQACAETAGVTLVTVPAALTVDVDPVRIGQVLANVLSNAIKFSGTGDTVRLEATRESAHVTVRVSDEGRGIPPDKLEAIFERFTQVDASDSRQQGGTGLGLPICRAIVAQHGGRIWAESRLGVGSTFLFTLPLS